MKIKADKNKKLLQLNELQHVLKQGESRADSPVIVLPTEREGVNLTALSWSITAATEEGTFTAASDLPTNIEEGQLFITWVITSNFTDVATERLELTLTGSSENGEVVVKFEGDSPLQVSQAKTGEYTPPPYVLDQAIAKANEAAQRAETAADEAESYSSHPPQILESGNWGAWDGTGYADTGKPSRGENGQDGQDGRVYEVHAGTGVNVDNSDPANPVVSAAMSGVVESVVAGANIQVNDSDPAHPVISALSGAVWQDMEPAEGMTAAYAKFIRLTDSLAFAVIDISISSGTFGNLQKLCSFPAGVNALPTTYQPCTYLQGSSLAPGLVYPGGRSASGGPGVYTNYGFTDKNRVIATLMLEIL